MIHESNSQKVVNDSVPLKYFLMILREQKEMGNEKSVKMLLTDKDTWFDDLEVTWRRNSL
jgi:hypothetical protein